MDKINEYLIDGKPGEYCIEVPQNSTILSARKVAYSPTIAIVVLIDVDNFENLVERNILVFDTESEIADNMKANFLGPVTVEITTDGKKAFERVVYVFEKLR